MIKSMLSSEPLGDKRVTTYSWGSIAIFLDDEPLPMFQTNCFDVSDFVLFVRCVSAVLGTEVLQNGNEE